MSSGQASFQGCRSVEEFQCLNRIEEGTYGVVYRAKDKKTGGCWTGGSPRAGDGRDPGGTEPVPVQEGTCAEEHCPWGHPLRRPGPGVFAVRSPTGARAGLGGRLAVLAFAPSVSRSSNTHFLLSWEPFLPRCPAMASPNLAASS